MIHTGIGNYHQINDQIRDGKIKIGKAFTFTDGGTLLDTEIISK